MDVGLLRYFSVRGGAAALFLLCAVTIYFISQYPISSIDNSVPLSSKSVLSSPPSSYSEHNIYFEANVGQVDAQVSFLARAEGYTLFLTPEGAYFSLANEAGQQSPVFKVALQGANVAAKAVGEQRLSGRSHYYKGDNSQRWSMDAALFEAVRYQQVYPGVDLVYYGSDGQLEYDFIIAPGSDPSQIQLAFEDVDAMRINDAGELIVTVSGEQIIQQPPFAYQQMQSGERQQVASHYYLNEQNQLAFQLAAYDKERALIIDPVLVYSSFHGGSGDDRAHSMVRDSSGNLYVAGETSSVNFPETSGSSSLTGDKDVFVSKFSSTGTLLYSVYLGGSKDDVARDVAVDASGNVYLAGETLSPDFPATGGAFDTTCAANANGYCSNSKEAFAVKLDAAGSLTGGYATYLGGTLSDVAYAVAVDGSGNAYVAGSTNSIDFPTTGGVLQTALSAYNSNDAFMVKLNAAGSALTYSTYLGGALDDVPHDIDVDAGGNVFVVGFTLSSDYPTASAYDASCGQDGQCGQTIAQNRLVALGSGGTIISSPDGTVWTARTSGTGNVLQDVVWSGAQFVVVGDSGTILTSPDGVTWTSRTSGTANNLQSIVWNNSQFVSVGNTGTILTSPDGITWTTRTSGTTNNLLALSWNGSQFVSVGSAGTILTSADGISWATQVSGSNANLQSIAWNGSLFAVVGSGGAILTSPAGITWTAASSGSTEDLQDILWGDAQFVVVGNTGTILTSVDGSSWLLQDSKITTVLSGIAKQGTQYAAVGDAGVVLTSSNAATWTAQTSGSGSNLAAVAWSGGSFRTDAFISKLNATGTALTYSTFLGGEGYDFANAIRIDSAGNAYITGSSRSTGMATSGVYQNALAGSDDAFVARLNAAGSGLDFFSYLGGKSRDIAQSLELDGAGNIYVTGYTYSTDFPTASGLNGRSARCTEKTTATTYACEADVFVSKLDIAGTALAYSLYLGGNKSDFSNAIAVDSSGLNNVVYISGYSDSAQFPVTSAAIQSAHGDVTTDNVVDQSDAWLARIDDRNGDLAVIVNDTVDPVTVGNNISYSMVVTNNAALDAYGIVAKLQLGAGLTYVSATTGCSENAGLVTCSQGQLAGSASTTFSIVALPRQDGSYVSSASVSAYLNDSDSSNDTASTTTTAVLAASSSTTTGGGAYGFTMLLLSLMSLVLGFRRQAF